MYVAAKLEMQAEGKGMLARKHLKPTAQKEPT